mgnify:CR=1 FL=1
MQQQDISQLPIFEEENSIGTVHEDQILNLALQGHKAQLTMDMTSCT